MSAWKQWMLRRASKIISREHYLLGPLCITHKTYYAVSLCMFCIRWLELLTKHKSKNCVITNSKSPCNLFGRFKLLACTTSTHQPVQKPCTSLHVPKQSPKRGHKENAHLKKTHINHRWNSLMWRTSKSSLNQSLKMLGKPIRFFYRIPWLNPSRCVHYTACEPQWTVWRTSRLKDIPVCFMHISC